MDFPVIVTKWLLTIFANGGSAILGLLFVGRGFHWNVSTHDVTYFSALVSNMFIKFRHDLLAAVYGRRGLILFQLCDAVTAKT